MVIGVILVILLIRLVQGDDVDHDDLERRLTVLEQQATFQTCILGVPPDAITPQVIAECQVFGE